MRNKVFAAVFFAFVLIVMVSAPLKIALTRAGVVETANVGNIIQVEKVYKETDFGADFFNSIEEFKRDVNDVYTNYIPFYVSITSQAEGFTQRLNQPVSAFLMNQGNQLMMGTTPDQPADTFETQYTTAYLKSDRRHRYYQITAKAGENDPLIDFYIRVPSKDAESLRPAMEKQVSTINDFATRRPDVNFYVFPVTCFEDTKICQQILPAESKYILFTEFFEKLDPSVQYDYIKINEAQDKANMYFKTDHHWNVNGYLEGYRLITDMFKKNYPDIVPLDPKILTFDNDITVYGSNALAVSNYDLSDIFHAADYNLPEHNYVLETAVSYGGTESIQESTQRYLNKQHNTKRSYNHYIHFYPIVKEVTYPQNNTGRKLLIIGDSYSPPLLEALASHFDTTYIRYVDENKTLESIRYEELIDKYGITDVLVLEMSDRVIYDYYSDSLRDLK